MRKLWIIVRREYLTRVRQRMFLVATFLVPILFAAITFLPILATGLGDDTLVTVYYPSGSPTLDKLLESGPKLKFIPTTDDVQIARTKLKGKAAVAYLILPEDLSKENLTGTLYTPKALDIQVEMRIRRSVEKAIEKIRLTEAGITPEKLQQTKFEFSITAVKWNENGEEKTSALLATIVAHVMSFMIYFMIVLYGAVLMRGVAEEKANRIAEVIISSVKPWQLMFGKVLGIGAMGLTQFIIWVVGLVGLVTLGGLALGLSGVDMPAPNSAQMPADQQMQMARQIQQGFEQFHPSILLWFLFYFLGGYVLYGALMAGLAATVDQETDSQQLAIFVWLPLIVPIMFISYFVANPNSSATVWCSIIPLFSPIVMMARLAATDVPWWQLALSALMMIGGVILAGWVAGRIYRTAILLYGKKPSLGLVLRWVLRG